MAICYLFCIRFCVSLYTTATCTISQGFKDHLLYQRVCKAPKIELNESLNSAVMRSVPQRLKSFQMSLQLLLVRIFGSIPGPILMGMFIDRSCVLWQVDEDGNKGSCFVYDNRKMVEAFCYFRKFFEISN